MFALILPTKRGVSLDLVAKTEPIALVSPGSPTLVPVPWAYRGTSAGGVGANSTEQLYLKELGMVRIEPRASVNGTN